MKKLFFLLMASALVFSMSCKSTQMSGKKAGQNQLTKKEKAEGWVLLFDGETSEGWRGDNKAHFPTKWKIVDGTIHFSGKTAPGDGGNIITTKEFSNFRLKLEWKISPGGNSGIFYLGKETEGWKIPKTAPEMQVLDNEKHPDASKGKNGNRKAGSLYDLIPATPQNARPVGEWNQVEIEVNKGKVRHIQNGETVVEYELWTDEWKAMVKDSKFPGLNPDWANVPKKGVIALQDHGNKVWYRNIKILEQ
jgi:hypothetical protein